MQKSSDESKKKTPSTELTCHHCGVEGHYKKNCPDLLGEEKPSGRKNAQEKCSRSAEKSTEAVGLMATLDDGDRVHKREVVVGEAVKWAAKNYDPSQWYFDTGTNAHIVACKEYFTMLPSMDDRDWNPTISGFADGISTLAEGFSTLLLATVIDEEMVFMEDVRYVPQAGCNLFSPGLALDQGFQMLWDQGARIFGMSKDGTEVVHTKQEHRLWTFNAHNIGGTVASKKQIAVKQQVVANFAVTDGVEDIDIWHERLAHTCPEYIRLMVDRNMANGIMLKKRGKVECADCHFGQQRRKTFQKKLDRDIERVNDLVFADLLIPGLQNSAVLVVMDAYSRYVTTYLLKTRTQDEVNARMQEYIAWAERQHGVIVGTLIVRSDTS
ncbi:hypothetical protein JG688_00014636 [Phytophthora aleatoria]|uniref:CCHC-type domain-containing protein n=1 Tax=Phytophthora aleatoria TaxID=2496075 RepID=A0A8J5IWR6_9STRA|nr:hypothetical protein JG688_00014636 [Phytophthora aleatoria]